MEDKRSTVCDVKVSFDTGCETESELLLVIRPNTIIHQENSEGNFDTVLKNAMGLC